MQLEPWKQEINVNLRRIHCEGFVRHLDRFLIADFCAILSQLTPHELPGRRRCLNSLPGCRSEVSLCPQEDSQRSFGFCSRLFGTTGARRGRTPCFEKGLTADTFALYIYVFIYFVHFHPSVSPVLRMQTDSTRPSYQSSDAFAGSTWMDGRFLSGRHRREIAHFVGFLLTSPSPKQHIADYRPKSCRIKIANWHWQNRRRESMFYIWLFF